MQEKVYQTHIANIAGLEHKIVQVWTEQDHRHIAAAIKQWQRCPNACDTCEKAEWGYFEQNLHGIDM